MRKTNNNDKIVGKWYATGIPLNSNPMSFAWWWLVRLILTRRGAPSLGNYVLPPQRMRSQTRHFHVGHSSILLLCWKNSVNFLWKLSLDINQILCEYIISSVCMYLYMSYWPYLTTRINIADHTAPRIWYVGRWCIITFIPDNDRSKQLKHIMSL